MKNNPLLIATLFAACLAPAAPLRAQGTKADYERAAELPAAVRGKVLNQTVRPRWQTGGGDRLWYRRELPGGGSEYVVVDAKAGTRRVVADLAAARTAAGDAGEPAGLPALAPEAAPRRSGGAGAEVHLAFANETREEMRLFWLDGDGNRQPYGAVPAGASRTLRTFAGHAWLAARPDGTPFAVFVAEEDAERAVIGPNPPDVRRGRTPGGRRAPGGGGAPSGVSPDGKWAASIREGALYLREQATGKEAPLSAGGGGGEGTVLSGPVRWSPDSKKLVAYRTTPGQEHPVTIVESSPRDQVQPKITTLNYLKPGDRIPTHRPRLFDVELRREVPLDDSLAPTPWMDRPDVHWRPDGSAFFYVYNQRGHQTLRVLRVDAATGGVKAVVDEQSDTLIDYANRYFLRYLDATDEIVWMSERDGWNHLYLYDAKNGRVKNQITKGPWVVRGVEEVDAGKRQVLFRAGGIAPAQDPYYVHWCRVNLDGTGLVDLTPDDGTHTAQFSPDGKYLVDTYSRVDLPPVTTLRRASDGKLVRELERADATALKEARWRQPERFAAKGRDGRTDIYGVIFRPTNFDPAKKYPVVENIYAGPQGSFVPKAFAPLHGPQRIAELGFIVVQIDGMGTANRSKAFNTLSWKNLGDAGFPDRIAWMKAAAATRPEMDLTRVGLYGGSAGGQNALRGLLAHGDFYKVGVADCGCHDNRMDKIWWNELYMGWPVGPHYAEQSNVTQAHRLTGKLLLIVGEKDTNVDPASTMQVADALVRADKDFDLLVIPGAGHGAAETPYGSRRRADFLVRHLHGVEPRSR